MSRPGSEVATGEVHGAGERSGVNATTSPGQSAPYGRKARLRTTAGRRPFRSDDAAALRAQDVPLEPYVYPFVEPQASAGYVRETQAHDVRERRSGLRYLAVRLFEVVIASLVLLVVWPILLAMIIAIRLDSPGPAIFRQRRVGLDLHPFTLYKARTLYVDARTRFPELYRYEFSREEVRQLTLSDLKTPTDPRVTRVGRWLRRTSIDELPNFINVLRGDLALVGPRPEIYECLKYYEGEQLLKFAVRPGLTGLAQVSGRNRNSFQRMIAWDVLYVRSRTFWLDVKILARTVKAVVGGDGAW